MARALICLVVLAACQPAEEASDAWSGWRSYAGSADSAQYSSLTQINRQNVARLEEVWSYPTGPDSHRCSPIVVDGVMYVVANGGVAALNAATGEQRWFASDAVAPNARGFAYWPGEAGHAARLLVVKGHELRALDAATGAVIGAFGDAGGIDLRRHLRRDPESITRVATMTPGRVFENLIIVGSAVGDETYGGAPGDIRAYDVRSGELVWSFHTIPLPGEYGHDTWPPDAWRTIGAANAWSNMAVDEARGLVYVPTGAPSYHFHGANRHGDNLFANSLIALDARTGERRWHFQAVHHDVWDYDIAMGPKLLRVERGGRSVDAVVLAGKHGLLYVFDRETGEPVYPIEERPVPRSDVPGEQTSPTQPFSLGLPPFANFTLDADDLSPYADPEEVAALAARIRAARNEGLFTPPSFRGSVSAPGSRGGAQFGNGAVIPDAGMFYFAVIESPTIPKLEERRDFSTEQFSNADAAEIYASACAVCHGAGGEGQLPLFPALAGAAQRLGADAFAAIVKQGRGRMAAFPKMPDAQIAALAAYVDGLSGAADAARPEPAALVPDAQRYRSGYHHFFSPNGLIGPPPWSKLIAYDLNQGRILWEKPYGDVPVLAAKGITGTGSLFPTNSLAASAGGLLFSVTNDRKIRAWDQTDGAVLWSADLPADPGGIPALYAIDGRQYVVATATRGDTGAHAYVAFALPATRP